MRRAPLLVPVLLPVLAFAAALRAQEKATPLTFHGLDLDLPKGWTTQQADAVLLLKPAGWKQDSLTGEAYGLLFDAETKTLDGEDFAGTIDSAAEEILPGMKRAGGIATQKLGAFDGRVFTYTGRTGNGQDVTMRIHVCLPKEGAVALFALGFPDKLKARGDELTALLGSLRAAGQPVKKRAFGMGPGAGGDKPAAGEAGAPAPVAQDAPTKPAAKDGPRLPGGTPTDWKGMTFDLPKGWTTKPGDDGALGVLPPDFGKSGILDEIYVFAGDGSVRSLDAADLAAKVQQALDEIQPGLLPDGGAKATKYGELAGKTFTFRGQSPTGQDVLANVYAFPTPNGVAGLVGLGFPDKLGKRQTEVLAMLATLRAAKAPAGGVAQELVGQWNYFSNFNATNGGGRMSSTSLTLRADGTYTYAAETSSSNPFGGAASQQNDAGSWSLQGDSLVFVSQSGQRASYRLEKRNHPKNRDPMLLLDGKAFVTATQRAPW